MRRSRDPFLPSASPRNEACVGADPAVVRVASKLLISQWRRPSCLHPISALYINVPRVESFPVTSPPPAAFSPPPRLANEERRERELQEGVLSWRLVDDGARFNNKPSQAGSEPGSKLANRGMEIEREKETQRGRPGFVRARVCVCGRQPI